MHPVLCKVGPFTIYSYGVMVALGFGIATAFVYNRAPKFGIDRNHVVDLMIIMLISGIAGARAFYVLQDLGYYRAHPVEILDLSRGGLVWYGAFLAGLGGCSLYIRAKRMDFWAALDLAAPYIALAQAVGRIGCLLNGCCYGIEASQEFPLAIPSAYDGAWHHPTQIYSALALFAIFIILRTWQDRRHFAGEIFLGYCVLYSLKRFLMEFARGDNARIFLHLTVAQLISLVMLKVALIVFIIMAVRRWKKR